MNQKKKNWLRQNLRVAIFTGNYNYIRDGVAVSLNKLVSFLESQGIEVLVFAPTARKAAFEHSGTVVSVPSVPIPNRPEYRVALGLTRRARLKLKEFGPTLFHIAVPDILGYQALKFARRSRIPAVASYHTRYDTYFKYYRIGFLERIWRRYISQFYHSCEHLYAPSESMRDILTGEKIATEIRVWSRGVDTDQFDPAHRSQIWRDRYGVGPNEVLVTFVGRFVREKNMAALTSVFSALHREGIACRTMIVGSGPEEKGLRRELPQAIFPGFLVGDDLARAYASSDIFFFPSVTETFGNVTTEAMASGLPAVCADASGSRSLVIHQKTGFLVNPEAPSEFVHPIRQLVEDEKLRKEMGSAARNHVMDKFSWDRVMNEILHHYFDVLSANKPN